MNGLNVGQSGPRPHFALCDELRKQFDYTIIDSPAGIEQGFRNSIAGADEVLVVTNPEVSSVRDSDRILGIIQAKSRRAQNGGEQTG